MTTRKAKRVAETRRYPEPVAIRSGCKVSWKYFKTREDAEAAAAVAREEGVRQAALGYDFGYRSPGEIILCSDHYWSQYKGLFEVTFP